MKRTIFFFFLLLLLGFLVRLYRFSNPVADWHSWRQADTSSVSRNFLTYGFDLLHPRINNISNVQSGKENPQGYFFAEFPLYNATQAGLYKLFGFLTIEEWGRMISIISSLVGSIFLFLLVKKRIGTTASWLVFFFSLFLPYTIYYSRTILPDTSMVMAMLGGIYFFDRFIRTPKQKLGVTSFIFSILFTMMALLLKPYAFFYAPVFLALSWEKWKGKLLLQWKLWLFALITLAPLVWWRTYILKYPEGIPSNMWLLNGNGIRFRPAFFRWIFYERITKLISGYIGVIFLLVSGIALWKDKKNFLLFASFVISSLLYLCVIATGNVQHDYYQIVIMPTIALCMGIGSAWTIMFLKRYIPVFWVYLLVGMGIALAFYLSWFQVKDYFNINNPNIVVAGLAVDKLTPKNAKVIAPYDGDSSFLYQTNRQGWASFEHDLPDMIKLGADYLVIVNPQSYDFAFAKTYKLMASTSAYVLYNLHKTP